MTNIAIRPAAYEQGTILASAADEARKSTQGRRLIQERVKALGKESIYNLTGLVRTFPLRPEDLDHLENQFTFGYLEESEELPEEAARLQPRRRVARARRDAQGDIGAPDRDPKTLQ